jgi:hypothetical protein
MAAYDFTEANLIAIRNAQIAYATGTRKVRLSMGDKSIEYAVSSLDELERMEAKILSELQTTATRPRFFLTSTDKGL